MDKLRLYLSEFLGAFILVLIGVGSISGSHGNPASLLAISLAFGFAVAVVVAATGHISGAHINPAVTLAVLVAGKIKFADAISYMVAQLLGATFAALVLRGLLGQSAAAVGVTNIDSSVSIIQGLVIEVVLTFILVFVIFGTAVDMRSQKLPALFIGLTVAIDILVGGPFTGGSMNPARSFGPALVSGMWANHWIYWLGPLVGGALAGVVYSEIFLPRTRSQADPEVRTDAALPAKN